MVKIKDALFSAHFVNREKHNKNTADLTRLQVIQLSEVRYFPIIMYRLDARPVNASDEKFMDFADFENLANIFGTFSFY